MTIEISEEELKNLAMNLATSGLTTESFDCNEFDSLDMIDFVWEPLEGISEVDYRSAIEALQIDIMHSLSKFEVKQ